ncbi:MAG: glycosyltransferase [Patescibacteria group bacterium]|jgi:glycosyltransferase involved in cell wall biosynthesis
MKIALVNNLYFPFNRGGAEQVVAESVRRLRTDGHEVFLIATCPSDQALPLPSDLKIYWIKSQYYNLNKKKIISRLIWQIGHFLAFKKYRQIKKILQTERPDRLLTHNLMGLGWRLPALARRLKIPQEHFLHDIQLLHPSGLIIAGREKKVDSVAAKIYQALTRSIFASPAKIISPSRWLLEEHRRRGFFKNSRLSVEPWSDSNVQSVPNRQTASSETADGRTFLFIGQIEEHKGIIFLIKAWKELIRTTGKPTRLRIVGSGSKLAEAKALADGLESIEFLGYLKPEELPRVLEKSHYLIVPSLCYENSPTIIARAHSLGLPVIASDLGGIPEMCNQNDKLFQAGNQTELIKIIKNLTA